MDTIILTGRCAQDNRVVKAVNELNKLIESAQTLGIDVNNIDTNSMGYTHLKDAMIVDLLWAFEHGVFLQSDDKSIPAPVFVTIIDGFIASVDQAKESYSKFVARYIKGGQSQSEA